MKAKEVRQKAQNFFKPSFHLFLLSNMQKNLPVFDKCTKNGQVFCINVFYLNDITFHDLDKQSSLLILFSDRSAIYAKKTKKFVLSP